MDFPSVSSTFYCFGSLHFYESLGVVRIDQDLFRCYAVLRNSWKFLRKTRVFKLDKHASIMDFYILFFDNWNRGTPLTEFVLMKKWSFERGTYVMCLKRIQKWWKGVLRVREQQGKALAFAMAFHDRLGIDSRVNVIGVDMGEKIVNYLI